MKLVKWNNRPALFNEAFSNFFDDDFIKPHWGNLPAVNIKESEGEYGIEVAAPGLKKDDFHIDLEKDVLTISVTLENEQKDENHGYTRREFRFNSFKRSFVLPDAVDVDSIKGTYENGILHLTLPKKAEVLPAKKTIAIA